MAHVIGILDGDAGAFGVRIPDVPGCHGAGATADDAISDAISALRVMADDVRTAQFRDARAIVADADAEYDPAVGETLVFLPVLVESDG